MTDPAPPPEGLALEAFSRPVRGGNAFEETLARLLQLIRLGVVPPGEALAPERELAARLEVSRDTVREAIRALAEAGYVESRRGRYGGTFVREPLPHPEDGPGERVSADEVRDALLVRDVLEVGAARAAASTPLTAAQRDDLATRMREVAAAEGAEYRRLDSRLHLTLGELAGSPTLVSLLADNRMRVNTLLDRIPLLPPNIAHSNEQHERIVWAVLSGDADGAAAAMTEHLEGTASLLRGFLA
ncbi:MULTISPECIES: FadR/GntR family transcriptional regulator [unclassified Microcella]|uniref:FadR/GntR family transcriptional regulator n=1 Tax=unclassified Microcella TaxID=2630066 RepID=UPI0006F3056D|nr:MULTISPECIES: FCD domain-containing protein [unclassified Microcella]KQV24482.1 GntR family transcriptional regulator [Yonghaparkia sp. Root332]KRF30774.1 GntR family transcriptional regulator [Yonghaparkia sp. Soil809]